MWGRLLTCGRLAIGLALDPGNSSPSRARQADCQSAAGCQPAPHATVEIVCPTRGPHDALESPSGASYALVDPNASYAEAGRARRPPGDARDRDRADHAPASTHSRSADRRGHSDLDHSADGVALPNPAGGIHVVSHDAAVAHPLPPGAEYFVLATDPAQRQHRDL